MKQTVLLIDDDEAMRRSTEQAATQILPMALDAFLREFFLSPLGLFEAEGGLRAFGLRDQEARLCRSSGFCLQRARLQRVCR